jgi:ribosome recycling factor
MLHISFVEGSSTKQFEGIVEREMSSSLTHFEKELTKLRTGRAHPSMVSDIRVMVESYGGNEMTIDKLASISTPEPQLIVIQPWDTSVIADIEKGLSRSDLGVNPINDGEVIRINLPKMSGSRRDELIKVVAKRAEECKISVRTVRKDVHNLIRDAEKQKQISEDYSKRLQTSLQKITDTMTEKVDSLAQRKEQEIKAI